MGAILIHNSSAAFRQDSISGWPYFLRKGGLIPNFAIYIYIHIFVHFCFIDSLLPPPPYLTFFPNFNIYIFLYIFYSQLGVLSPPPPISRFFPNFDIYSDSFLAAPPYLTIKFDKILTYTPESTGLGGGGVEGGALMAS